MEKMIARSVQSENIPIQTAIGPISKTLTRTITKDTRKIHIERIDTTIENLTSPAALNPYAGINANVQTIGLTIVMQVSMKMHIDALPCSIPPKYVIGRTRAKMKRQDAITTTSPMMESFFT